MSNYFIYFIIRNGELNVKNNTVSWRKKFVFLFFIGENNERIKKLNREEMCGSKCSIFIYYIYFFNKKKFFSNLHLDRVDRLF